MYGASSAALPKAFQKLHEHFLKIGGSVSRSSRVYVSQSQNGSGCPRLEHYIRPRAEGVGSIIITPTQSGTYKVLHHPCFDRVRGTHPGFSRFLHRFISHPPQRSE